MCLGKTLELLVMITLRVFFFVHTSMITSLFQRVPNVIQVRGSLDIGGPRGVEFLPSAEVLPRSVCCADFLGSCLFEQVHS